MKNYLTTSALIAPFLLGAALAQDAPADPPLVDEPVTEMETTGATDQAPDMPETDEFSADDGLDDATDPLPDTDTVLDTPEPDTDTALEAPEPDAAETDALSALDGASGGEPILREQAASELRVDWLTGTNVRSPQDESIGSIRDLIIDQETHQITGAVLSVGGVLGMGGKDIAVRFDELQIDYDAREITMNLTREEADAAPEFVFRERAEAPAPIASDGGGAMGGPIAPID